MYPSLKRGLDLSVREFVKQWWVRNTVKHYAKIKNYRADIFLSISGVTCFRIWDNSIANFQGEGNLAEVRDRLITALSVAIRCTSCNMLQQNQMQLAYTCSHNELHPVTIVGLHLTTLAAWLCNMVDPFVHTDVHWLLSALS